MDETISAIDTITSHSVDIWAPAPITQGAATLGKPYVRVTTSGGVVGWGESFAQRVHVVAAFDN
jgi:L-alanine-DL-glutamate epimerase-like enolase superfamily enzyme